MSKKENQNIEFKENWRDDILKTICAFANTDGGVVYIGVNDKGYSIKLKNEKRLLEEIPNKIRDILGIVADVKLISKQSKPVIKIYVNKYSVPISYKGKFYKRSGSTTSELKGLELSRFLVSHSGMSLVDAVEPRATLRDINIKTVRYFQELSAKRFPFISKEKDIKLILQKLNLVEKGKLKRAAILLFGKDPRKYFNSAFIQVGRFISESEVISTDIIDGNLFELVERTMEVLRLKYLENRFYYEGIYRKEDLIYPEDALREAVINAVIHRDYLGPHIQLRVYDNKLWLWNIGKLPPEITLEQLKQSHSSYPRNELLADIFFKAGFIESWGRGTLKIIDKCKEKGLPEPEFSEMTGGFLVVFYKAEPAESKKKRFTGRLADRLVDELVDGLAESQKKIIMLIKENPYISKKDLAEKIGISITAIDKNIAQLKKKSILRRIGPDKGGYWEVMNSFIFYKAEPAESKKKKFTGRLADRLVDELVDGLAESQKKIIMLIKENPYISKKDLAEKIGISITAIDKNIAQLKKKSILRRIGPDKGGYWEVIER